MKIKNPNYKNDCARLCEQHGAALDAYFAALADTVEAVTADDIRAGVPALAALSEGELEAMCKMRGFARA